MAAPKNPVGPKSDKIWRDAIMRAVKREVEKGGGRKLEKLADKLVERGLDGDVSAMREIGDRIDGKPVQAISGADGGAVVIQVVTGVPERGN